LEFGKGQGQLMAFELGGESPEKIAALREELAIIEKLKKAEEDRKETERQAKKEKEEAARLAERELQNTINTAKAEAKLRDEIAVMNGEMTKRDARVAELFRGGKSMKDAELLAGLEEEKDSLGSKGGKTGFAAFGSNESASTLARVFNGTADPIKDVAKNTARTNKLLEDENRRMASGRNDGPTLDNLDQA
jgi:hypothetical protein